MKPRVLCYLWGPASKVQAETLQWIRMFASMKGENPQGWLLPICALQTPLAKANTALNKHALHPGTSLRWGFKYIYFTESAAYSEIPLHLPTYKLYDRMSLIFHVPGIFVALRNDVNLAFFIGPRTPVNKYNC